MFNNFVSYFHYFTIIFCFIVLTIWSLILAHYERSVQRNLVHKMEFLPPLHVFFIVVVNTQNEWKRDNIKRRGNPKSIFNLFWRIVNHRGENTSEEASEPADCLSNSRGSRTFWVVEPNRAETVKPNNLALTSNSKECSSEQSHLEVLESGWKREDSRAGDGKRTENKCAPLQTY